MPKIMSFMGHALSNLFHKPVTRNYPSVKNEFTPRTRGSIEINIEDCLFCGICQKKCPSNAISVNRETKEWSIERMGCVQCENCVNACPKKCLSTNRNYTEPDFKPVTDVFKGKVDETKKDGKVQINSELCVYCGLCVKKCPEEAITVNRQDKKWEINHEKCVKCGACVTGCPKKCLSIE